MIVPDLTINEGVFELAGGGQGKVAVLIYTGSADPSPILDRAVSQYVGNTGYNELIDANMDNPWMRVILSNINDMHQEPFDPERHSLATR